MSVDLRRTATIGAPKGRYDATMTVLRSWASADPATALAYVDENPNSQLPEGSLNSVFRGIGKAADPTAALSFLSGLTDARHQLVS
jgi:hypothetical protein